LPEIEFMHLANGSDLINAGIDLGFPFLGSAPDLGAFETSKGVGVTLLSESTVFKSYQNSEGFITIQFQQEREGSAMLSVYDITVKRIHAQQLNGLSKGRNDLSLPISISKGIYLLSLNSCGKRYSTKMIIE